MMGKFKSIADATLECLAKKFTRDDTIASAKCANLMLLSAISYAKTHSSIGLLSVVGALRMAM